MKYAYSLVLITVFFLQTASAQDNWRAEFSRLLPAMGHRNWILVVDAAYPLQIKPGIVTLVTGEEQLDVVKEVLAAIKAAPHVSPEIFLDQEIDFVPEKEFSEIKKYKRQLDKLLEDEKVSKLLHEQLIGTIAAAGQDFKVLVLKTNLTMPYTSVFFRLDCGYWKTEQEQMLRENMK